MNCISITESEVVIKIDDRLYPESTVFKCFYWYGADYDVSIEKDGASRFLIAKLTSKEGKIVPDKLLDKIRQDLIDFKLRDIVADETRTIRELITAKAFANFSTDEIPQTEIADPLGFDPKII